MRKLFFILGTMLILLNGCGIEELEKFESSNLTLDKDATSRESKILVCHYSKPNKSWGVIFVSSKSLQNHLNHGDVRLDDQDGDGYVPNNECGYGNMGDDDDTNACISPRSTSLITGIRLGGQSGDAYIGPTCNNDGTYRTCFYVTGTNLPGDINSYKVILNGEEYPVAFFQVINANTVVICISSIESCESVSTSVSIQANDGCALTINNLFNSPSCPSAEISNIRLGGQSGDAYIGLTCNNDGTYRTCYYVTGSNLPNDSSKYTVKLNDTEYPIAFFQTISATEVVICVTGIEACEVRSTDVSIQAGLSCTEAFVIENMYDAPICPTGEVTNIRLGGQPGDAYIGPNCNNDGTYRTCYYVSGTSLPNDSTKYIVKLNDTEYPIAFVQSISANEVVICLTNLPNDGIGIDVLIQPLLSCSIPFEIDDLYDAPNCSSARMSSSNGNLNFYTNYYNSTVHKNEISVNKNADVNIFTNSSYDAVRFKNTLPVIKDDNQNWLIEKN